MYAIRSYYVIEDVAFPTEHLAEAALDLQKLFSKYHYHEALIFGHALEGNLHFVFTQDFGNQEEVLRYRNFMADVVAMVVDKYDGSLKAEHGTGRNMAPFVEKEWGEAAYQLMKDIKAIFDPTNLLRITSYNVCYTKLLRMGSMPNIDNLLATEPVLGK